VTTSPTGNQEPTRLGPLRQQRSQVLPVRQSGLDVNTDPATPVGWFVATAIHTIHHEHRYAERGHHDELLAAQGLYADLYRTQFASQDDPGVAIA